MDFSAPTDTDIFTLADDYRLVIDLPEVEWRVPAGASLNGEGSVTRVRYARNRPGRSRVVLDLAGPLSIGDRRTKKTGGVYRFIIDLEPTSRDEFMRTAGWPARHLLTAGVGAMRRASATPVEPKPLQVATRGSAPAPRPEARAPSSDSTKRVIVLDPGHGGYDPGAIGRSGIYEKTVTLAMGKELKTVLEATGRYDVRMTRSTDVFVELPDRVDFARTNDAALFLSIHADSNPLPSVRGTSVYTLSDKASDSAAARLAQKENSVNGLEAEKVTDDVLKILINLAQRDTMNNSVRLAQTLLPALRNRDVGLLRRTHRFGPFWVLTAADVPSVLIEMGFLSNEKDEQLVTSPEWRAKLALGIRDSLDAYFGYSEIAGLNQNARIR